MPNLIDIVRRAVNTDNLDELKKYIAEHWEPIKTAPREERMVNLRETDGTEHIGYFHQGRWRGTMFTLTNGINSVKICLR